MLAGVSIDSSAKIACQAPQPFLCQFNARTELIPPRQQATTGLTHREITPQGNAIDAVVGSIEQVSDISRELIRCRHEPMIQKSPVRRRRTSFSQQSLGKSVHYYRSNFAQLAQSFCAVVKAPCSCSCS